MKRIKLLLLLLFIPLVVFAAAEPKTKVQIEHVTTRVSGAAVVVDGYRFYVSTVPGFTPVTPAATVTERAGDIFTTLLSLVPPPAKGTYYVKVTAYKGTDEGGPSSEVSFYAVGDGTFFILAPLGAPGALRLL